MLSAVFFDALVLERGSIRVAERMGRFDVLLTAVITGPLVRRRGDGLVDRRPQAPIARGADLIVSASRLRDGGTLLRMAGVSVEQVGRPARVAQVSVAAPRATIPGAGNGDRCI